jgi:cyclopropane-fatty-acyl-phospholipid synthase
MADRGDIDFTYSLTDRVFRLSLGELADFSGAKYDGDFSLSLEQAQRRKHEYVAEQIGIAPGRRVLDLGCGWGPLLDFIRRKDARGLGVTLSWAQEAACRRHGLDVHLQDARQVAPGSTSALRRSIRRGARRRSTGGSSSASPRCCRSGAASTSRRWSSAGT